MKFKLIKYIALVFLCSIFFSGCLLNEEGLHYENGSAVLSDDSTQIIVWGLFEIEENFQPLIDEFISQNPEVEIVYTKKTKDDYVNELNTVLQDGNPNNTPDIFMIHNTWVGNYADFISNAPTSIYTIGEFRSDFHDFVSEDFGYGAQVRGVPLWVDLLGLVYHKNLLLDTGDTVIADDWSSFLRQAENMNKFNEDENLERGGFSAGVSENVEFHFEVLNLLMLQARDIELTEEARAVPFSEDEQAKIEEALIFYRSFENKTWNSNFKLDTAAFIEGNLASMIIPSWRLLDILAYDEDRSLEIDLGVAQVPQLNPETTVKVNFPSYWGYVVSKDGTKKNNSWKFLKFLGTKDAQEMYMNKQIENGRPFSMISPRKDLISSQEEDSYLSPYIDSIEYTHSWYMMNGYKLQEAYAGLVDGSYTIDEFLQTFEDIKDNENVL